MNLNQNATILIVDDEPENLQAIEDSFIKAGLTYTILKAPNGKIALSLAEKKQPDLMITDWDMPVVDGLTLIRQMKVSPKTNSIPVIMYTGVMTSSEDLNTALSAGAADYIRKPLDPVELIARTNSMLKLRCYIREISDKNRQLSEKNDELNKLLKELKTIKGIIPICSYCKKIRDEAGGWNQLEEYIRCHSDAEFSHGICPECYHIQMDEFQTFKKKRKTRDPDSSI